MNTAINNMTDTARGLWGNFFGKIVIVSLTLGWVPFYLLTEAHAALLK